jgi:hypothetical protein
MVDPAIQHRKRISSIKHTVLTGTTLPLRERKPALVDTLITAESMPCSLRLSRTQLSSTLIVSPIKTEPLLSESTPRCKSAYSRFQALKHQQAASQPDRLFSTVSLLFDCKNLRSSRRGDTI